QVTLDGLTNIANRRSFDEVLTQWLGERTDFAVIMIDIDFFKRVNDTYGHLIGDEVLKFLAREMEDMFANSGQCFRYGGEEFIVLLKNKSVGEAFQLAEGFRKKIAQTKSPCGDVI